jgi:hypothetical protein
MAYLGSERRHARIVHRTTLQVLFINAAQNERLASALIAIFIRQIAHSVHPNDHLKVVGEHHAGHIVMVFVSYSSYLEELYTRTSQA